MSRDLFTGIIDTPEPTGPGPRITVYGPRDQARVRKARKQGVVIIDTTSHSDDWGRQFSPFLLGPVGLYGDFKARNVENAWQFSKVYSSHVGPDGEPTDKYWRWARSGWRNPRAVRYPMGRGVRPLYSLWDGQKLGYVEARKQIYVPLYRECVAKTEAWAGLLGMARMGQHLHLWDFDGWDYQREGVPIEEALEDSTRKFGHSMVLALMLEQELRPS